MSDSKNPSWASNTGPLSRKPGFSNLYYKTYVENGHWRCEASPAGGHHWRVEPWPGPENKGTCRYCGAEREFPKSLDGAEFTEAQRGRIERFEMG